MVLAAESPHGDSPEAVRPQGAIRETVRWFVASVASLPALLLIMASDSYWGSVATSAFGGVRGPRQPLIGVVAIALILLPSGAGALAWRIWKRFSFSFEVRCFLSSWVAGIIAVLVALPAWMKPV